MKIFKNKYCFCKYCKTFHHSDFLNSEGIIDIEVLFKHMGKMSDSKKRVKDFLNKLDKKQLKLLKRRILTNRLINTSKESKEYYGCWS